MCSSCDNAVAEFGLGSPIERMVRRINHPPTPDEIRAERERLERYWFSAAIEAIFEAIVGPWRDDCECDK
jgi:hypothetical protein